MHKARGGAAILGHYPAEMAEIFGDAWTEPPQRDAETLNDPLRQAYLRGHIEAIRKAPSSTGRLSPATAAASRQAEHRFLDAATTRSMTGGVCGMTGGPVQVFVIISKSFFQKL